MSAEGVGHQVLKPWGVDKHLNRSEYLAGDTYVRHCSTWSRTFLQRNDQETHKKANQGHVNAKTAEYSRFEVHPSWKICEEMMEYKSSKYASAAYWWLSNRFCWFPSSPRLRFHVALDPLPYCLNIVSMNLRLSRWRLWPHMVPCAFMMHSRTAVPTPSRCFRPSLYISLPSVHEMRITWNYGIW